VPSTGAQQPAPAKPATSGEPLQAETAEAANLIKNLKLEAGQQEAARAVIEQGLAAAARARTEPVAAAPQQAATSATVLTNHAASPTLSLQPNVTNSQAVATSSDSESPALSTSQDSPSGFADGSTEDSDDSSAQSSSASLGSNTTKTGSGPIDVLPSSAFNSDAVSDVAPAAVHAVASATLQSNTGFDNAPSKAPETVSQNFNSAAQEKAFAAWQSVSDQVGRVVNTATLNALQNGTEMRVQLRTDAFGSMDIRATLEGGKVGAAIGVESAEAHNALLGQLPALQESLNERQVQLDQISLVSSYGQSGTDFGAGSGKQNGDPTPSGGYHPQSGEPEQVSEPASAPVTEAWQPGTYRGRLSVQA
jgi:flagellar hook-length control protein FliK